MTISWNQETFTTLAKPYQSWSDFLARYPAAQAAAKRGRFDPWLVFCKGGGKVASEVAEDLCDPEYHYRQLITAQKNAGLDVTPGADESARSTAEYVAAVHKQLLDHKIVQDAKRNAMTDVELVEYLNATVAYLLTQPESLEPYLRMYKSRGIPAALINSRYQQYL